MGELDVPLTEAISDLKDVGYITFAKPKDNTKQRLYLSRPENRCFSNFSHKGLTLGVADSGSSFFAAKATICQLEASDQCRCFGGAHGHRQLTHGRLFAFWT